MWAAREFFALTRQRMREHWKDATPRPLLMVFYAVCAPVCAGVSLESFLNQSVPAVLATTPFFDVRLWAQMLLVGLGWLVACAIGAIAGWFVSGVVTDLAEQNRTWGYRTLFTAIALPILLISAPLFLLPRDRDTVTTVLGVITAPTVATALCYSYRRSGWPENVPRG